MHKRSGADDLQQIHPLRRTMLTETSGGGQQNQTQQNQSQPSGSLFGNSTQTSQPQQSGGLFGGSTATSQPSLGGGLFGSALGGQSSQPQQGGGLFGSTANQNTSSGGGGLFGSTSNQQPQQQQSNTGGGLFGSSTMPSQSNTGGGGLFSSLNQNNQSNSNQQGGSSLFGGTSLFAPKNDTSQGMAGNQFYHANNPANRPTANSVFGLNAVPADQVPSLLRSQQLAQSQRAAPFAGSLRMGQSQQAAGAGQSTAVGAVKVHAGDLRPTTRFQDCIDEVKNEFEKTDKMIQAQEQFCRQIQAIISKHDADVSSVGPDVAMVTEKADAVEELLASDAQAVERSRSVADKDHKDFVRAQRVVENLKLPSGYQTPNPGRPIYGSQYAQQSLARPIDGSAADGVQDGDPYDTDLIGNYFSPLASELQSTLDQYSANLTEIEAHMRVIESSAVGQAQRLAAKRAGISGGGTASGEDTVRELADTLRGFEASIMGVAGTVGECREGVNELVLGRLGDTLGSSGRRPW